MQAICEQIDSVNKRSCRQTKTRVNIENQRWSERN